MNSLKIPKKILDRNVISTLETVDIQTGERKVLAQFNDLIEGRPTAGNWHLSAIS